MHVYEVLPDLDKPRHLSVWHKAIRGQWSPEEIDWKNPVRLSRDDLKDRLARILSPALMGEQAALYSVTSMIQILGRESDTESQFYLTSMAMDEARHTELFARMYHRLERKPLSIRRMPESYLFQSKIMSDVPTEWLTGSLVSEVIAKLTLEELKRLDVESVLSEIATRVLGDGGAPPRFQSHFHRRPLLVALQKSRRRRPTMGRTPGTPPRVRPGSRSAHAAGGGR